MFRSASSFTDLLCQSQAETPTVHHLPKRKQTIAVVASLVLLLLIFVSIAAATRREQNNRLQVEKVHPAMARLNAENFTIKAIHGPVAHEDSYGVGAAKPAQRSPPFLVFGSQNNMSPPRKIEDNIKELEKL
ncbi:hypothetical protein HPB50_023827 [Hyalomma asiaticum]|uniref:Uncharacterized protein n=1 Tax=Hyalomma asiaticum TaxID=266040 RepID=A0ACB7TLD2_HYAAI|nr:hypothetical protein HPB50_023827 [Hyalomma asiaticum]